MSATPAGAKTGQTTRPCAGKAKSVAGGARLSAGPDVPASGGKGSKLHAANIELSTVAGEDANLFANAKSRGRSMVERSRAKAKPLNESGVDIVLLEHPAASSERPAITPSKISSGREAMWGRALNGGSGAAEGKEAKEKSTVKPDVSLGGKNSSFRILGSTVARSSVPEEVRSKMDETPKEVRVISSSGSKNSRSGTRSRTDGDTPKQDTHEKMKLKMGKTLEQAKKLGSTALQSKLVVSFFVFFLTMMLLICLNPPMARTSEEIMVENGETGVSSVEIITRRSWKKIVIWSSLTFVLALLLPYTCGKKPETEC
jgi:hypothetical protein